MRNSGSATAAIVMVGAFNSSGLSVVAECHFVPSVTVARLRDVTGEGEPGATLERLFP